MFLMCFVFVLCFVVLLVCSVFGGVFVRSWGVKSRQKLVFLFFKQGNGKRCNELFIVFHEAPQLDHI